MALSEQQQEIRRRGIGASEVSALVGLDPYNSAISIYERILGLAPYEETFHTERGIFLEPGLREWASKRLGVKFEPSKTLAHPEHPRVIASPDGVWTVEGRVHEVLELKSPGPRTWHEWGDGIDEAPLRYVVQLSQQMAVTGARRGRIAALIDGDLRIYSVERDTELERSLIERIEDFWAKHIETRTPPPVDGSESAREWLARRYPNATKEWLTPDAEIVALAQQLAQTDTDYAAAEQRRELLQQKIKERIGGAYGVEVPGVGKITWGEVKGRSSIDWQAMAKHLGATEAHEAQFLKTGKGYRAFRFHPAKEGK